jgi:DNA-3-methyladenine glycosylase
MTATKNNHNRLVLPRRFYARCPADVARDLLGMVIVHRSSRYGAASAMIVETEAYLGTGDTAAHSARGITPRTKVLFGPPGFAYVYLIYGVHFCLNFVTEEEGKAGCVLIRAAEPIRGITGSLNGPGKLTRALGITLAQNATDLIAGPIQVLEHKRGELFQINTSPRIGITKSADLPLRFFIAGNPHVSRKT